MVKTLKGKYNVMCTICREILQNTAVWRLQELDGDIEELFIAKTCEALEQLSCTFEDVVREVDPFVNTFANYESYWEWKFLCVSFYILELLNNELSKSEMEILSVQETKNVKIALKHLMGVAVFKNIQANLPYYVKVVTHDDDEYYKYLMLKSSVLCFCDCIKRPNLRMLILSQSLPGILVGIFQIAYCPLKKPTKADHITGFFIMTAGIYERLLQEQYKFRGIMDDLRRTIHPAILVKQIMTLFQTKTPTWFKRSISEVLTAALRSKNGVENVALAMLDGNDDDVTKTWNVINVLTRLILSCSKADDFQANICSQITELLETNKHDSLSFPVFERLFVSCTKSLYSEDKMLCKEVFLQRMTNPLRNFTGDENVFFGDGNDVTGDIKQTVRLIHGAFIAGESNYPCLPIDYLHPLLNIIFYFYVLTIKTSFRCTNDELGDILIKYLSHCDASKIEEIFDTLLFGFAVSGILRFRSDIIIEVNDKIMVKPSKQTIVHSVNDAAQAILKLLKTEQKTLLFRHLVKCNTEKEKYFGGQLNEELLAVEDTALSPVLMRLLAVSQILSQLSEDQTVQSSLSSSPGDILPYMKNLLSEAISANNHMNENCEDNQSLFTTILFLENLISKSPKGSLDKYKGLIKLLSKIAKETSNSEIKISCQTIIKIANGEKVPTQPKCKEDMSELDKALEEVCDPLLPVRGHGLMVLSKLVQKKDKEAMQRKHYLLNLFQLSLKDKDAYIYLTAVDGLAALTDVFTDTVIEILCEEFTDYTKKEDDENSETRMKLGEVLVRVTRMLGDMAPKYKALLLNTFLVGAKDDDHLMRASSLSNLGECCRVLGYKLGTILTEVLVCVHAIISTDKAIEARRAAVSVIRQLFESLESEMISFLKEDILPIYRTLKKIYNNDKDDVMRLQAQLALEKLNENMKGFVFPAPKLNADKKIIMLN